MIKLWPLIKKYIAVLPYPAAKFVRRKVIMPFMTAFHIPPKAQCRKISFEVHLAEHCNLNCIGCSHFSPLAEPEFVNAEEFRRDMERMGEIFSHECEFIDLLGGEPLLNPEINTLMKIARYNFGSGMIRLISNGTLLTKQGADFWRTCSENNIMVRISRYPIKLDFKKIKEQADKFGADCEYYGIRSKSQFYKMPIDLSGSGDITENFTFCYCNTCTTLKHGRLYICSFIPHVNIFNRRFAQNVQVTGEDYIDIYKDITAEEILSRLTRPVPACRYCDTARMKINIKWGVSKHEMSEWV